MKTGVKLAITVFSLVATAHLLRIIFGIDITIGSWHTPQWISILGIIGPGTIAWLLWRECR